MVYSCKEITTLIRVWSDIRFVVRVKPSCKLPVVQQVLRNSPRQEITGRLKHNHSHLKHYYIESLFLNAPGEKS